MHDGFSDYQTFQVESVHKNFKIFVIDFCYQFFDWNTVFVIWGYFFIDKKYKAI